MSSLRALTLGQIVLGVVLVVLGAVSFIRAESSRDPVSFRLFLLLTGILLLLYTVSLWKRKKLLLACGFFINTLATFLGVMEMAFNGIAMFATRKPATSGAFLLSLILTFVFAGFGGSFNRLRKSGVGI
jgi:hypothetical protein